MTAAKVTGRVDRAGRLTAADPLLVELQQAAGSSLGRPLAIPPLAALARSAQSLVVPIARQLVAGNDDGDLDLFVRADPDADGVTLTFEKWEARAAAPARLTLDTHSEALNPPAMAASAEPLTWECDAAMAIVALSPALATMIGVDPEGAVGKPLTRLFRLIERDDGAMPLIEALAARADLDEQSVVARGGEQVELLLSAQPRHDEDGHFAGFDGRARRVGQESNAVAEPVGLIDEALDDALRSPLDKIIESADRIVERSDGPLRSDYASYASDIAAAGRHLMQVIRSMRDQPAEEGDSVDLIARVEEAIALIEPVAAAAHVDIEILRPELRIAVKGEGRGIVQILVNILGNAIRHSPAEGVVAVVFERTGSVARVTIADQGPGIERKDQARVFERYEQGAQKPGTVGLGLAISRRLARAMDGDVTLDSARGEGARFTLTLPLAAL